MVTDAFDFAAAIPLVLSVIVGLYYISVHEEFERASAAWTIARYVGIRNLRRVYLQPKGSLSNPTLSYNVTAGAFIMPFSPSYPPSRMAKRRITPVGELNVVVSPCREPW